MHPDLHVSLTTTTDHSSQLENYDVVIVYGNPQEKGYTLFEEALTPVISADLLEQEHLTLAELSRFTFLHPTGDSTDWNLWLNTKEIQVDMKRNQHFDTMDLAISAAIQGFCITVADVNLIQADVAMKRLVAPFDYQVKTGAVYSLLRREQQETPPLLPELVTWLCQR